MCSLRVSRKLFASLPAPITVGWPIMVMLPMSMVLGCGVYLFSMMDAAFGDPSAFNSLLGGITLSTPFDSNCWRMY